LWNTNTNDFSAGTSRAGTYADENPLDAILHEFKGNVITHTVAHNHGNLHLLDKF
tara:strand:+ start:301 stop:465 length:165 start_codon:yes stop_codon:yes gene_type:complete